MYTIYKLLKMVWFLAHSVQRGLLHG